VSALLAVYFIVSGSRDSEPRDSKRAGLVAQPHGLALRAQF
jgi:hypothetical protein